MPSDPRLILAGSLSALARGPLVAREGRVPLAHVARAGDRICAYLTVCPHEWARFEPRRLSLAGQACLTCKLHGVAFAEATGAVVEANSRRVPQGLRPVRVRMIGDLVYIALTPQDEAYLAAAGARWDEHVKAKKRRPGWWRRRLTTVMRFLRGNA